MTRELLVFWRLADGTRCAVLQHPEGRWQLRVTRGASALLVEDFTDPRALLARARELRPSFENRAA